MQPAQGLPFPRADWFASPCRRIRAAAARSRPVGDPLGSRPAFSGKVSGPILGPMTDSRDPRLTPARAALADSRLRGTVQAERYVEGRERRVGVASAPLRREPSPQSGIDTEVLLGDAVTFYDTIDGHAFVQLARDGYVGFLPEGSLAPADTAPTHVVTALRTFLYPEPDLKRPPLGHLSLGARPTALGVAGEYLETAAGFVFTEHCRDTGFTEADVAGTAERLVGTPYLGAGGRASASTARGWCSSACTSRAFRAPATRTSRRPASMRCRPTARRACGGATSCSGAAMWG